MAAAVKILKHFETPKEPGRHARLVCLTGKDKGLAFFLSGNRVVMGRSDKADIKIKDLKSSREHAEIAKVGKDYVLTDLGSQNGVVVNDLKIKQRALKTNDKVIIGQTVYRFNIVEVKQELQEVKNGEVEEFVDETFDDEKPNKKLTLTLTVVAVLALLLLFSEEDTTPKERGRKGASNYEVNELSDPFIASIKKKKKEDRKNKEKLNSYFRKGLRELREDNYFRAISEFEHALSWSPNDPLAMFYLRKTKEALDESIEEMFIKAKRDEDSLKYQNAALSYCSVLRLLHRYPEDERFKNAQESIGRIEGKMGVAEGAINCSEEINK